MALKILNYAVVIAAPLEFPDGTTLERRNATRRSMIKATEIMEASNSG